MEHPLYNTLSEGCQRIIRNFGCEIFIQLGLNKLSNDEIMAKYNYHDDGNSLKDTYENRIDILKQTHEQFLHENKETFKQQMEMKEETILQLQNKTKELLSSMEETITMKVHNEKQSANERNLLQTEIYEGKLSTLMEKINGLENENKALKTITDNLTDKKDFNNPTEQGNYTEKVFDVIIQEGLSFDTKATIEDTSQTGGSGDRIITFGNASKLMIEVKNKDTIKKSDMDEFKNHYEKDFEQKKVDCVLFFSNRTQQIPGKGKTIIPLYDEKNIIYYGVDDSLTPIEKKHRIISCLHEIYEKMTENKETTTEIKEEDNEIYNQHLKKLKNDKKEYEQKIKNSEKKKVDYEKLLNENERELAQLYKKICIHKINVDTSLLDDNVYAQRLIELIKGWAMTNTITFHKKDWRKQVIEGMNMNTYDSKIVKSKRITLEKLNSTSQ